MNTKKEQVYQKLNELKIPYKITEHIPVYTIEQMKDIIIENSDKIIKNLFLRNDKKDSYYLVLLEKDKKVNLKKLKQEINSRSLSFANEEELKYYLGLKKGSVTPLGILNDVHAKVKVIIDKDIKKLEFVGIHPNDNTATIWIELNDLEKIIKQNGNKILYVDI